MIRVALIVAAVVSASAVSAKERAAFISGQYATEANCSKLRKIEAGGPKNVETAPELLTADGFQGWEGGCEFTKIYEHDQGKSWLGLMVCTEGPMVNPVTYVFMKSDTDDTFDVAGGNGDEPELYIRCEAEKGN